MLNIGAVECFCLYLFLYFINSQIDNLIWLQISHARVPLVIVANISKYTLIFCSFYLIYSHHPAPLNRSNQIQHSNYTLLRCSSDSEQNIFIFSIFFSSDHHNHLGSLKLSVKNPFFIAKRRTIQWTCRLHKLAPSRHSLTFKRLDWIFLYQTGCGVPGAPPWSACKVDTLTF